MEDYGMIWHECFRELGPARFYHLLSILVVKSRALLGSQRTILQIPYIIYIYIFILVQSSGK